MKIVPIEYKCLIELEEIEHVSDGGIILPPVARESAGYQQEVGTLLAHGDRAFEDFGDTVPKIGDRILINKYAGASINIRKAKNKDQEKLRLVNDKDITAILEKDNE